MSRTMARRGERRRLVRDLKRRKYPPEDLPNPGDVVSMSSETERRDVTDGTTTYQQFEVSKIIYRFRMRNGETKKVEILL
jgi:hypothetical protein